MGFLLHNSGIVFIILIGYVECQCRVNCNSGTCKDGGTDVCVCNAGYLGEHCDIPASGIFCKGVVEYGYDWQETSAGGRAVKNCNSSGSTLLEGVVNRECGEDGVWKGVDLENCTNPKFNEIQQQLNQLVGISPGEMNVSSGMRLADKLANATTPVPVSTRGAFVGPSDVRITVDSLQILQLSISQKVGIERKEAVERFGTQWFRSCSNLIDPRNSLSFMSHILDVSTLINRIVTSLEGITRDYAECSTIERIIEHDNLQIIGGPVKTPSEGKAVTFPTQMSTILGETIKLDWETKSQNSTVFIGMSVSGGLSEIIEVALNSSELGNRKTPISRLVTVAAGGQQGRIYFSSPVSITFTIKSEYLGRGGECVYWNTSVRDWRRDGLLEGESSLENGIVCSSSHFASFCVLSNASLNYTDGHSKSLTKLILSSVTYTISVASLIALIAAIVIFLMLGKELHKKDLDMVHLNYAISLTVSLVMFVLGVQPIENPIVCGVIAGILHYAFLSVFAWSFCEAVLILYLLFALFTTRKIYPYLMLVGWGLPIPVVTLTAGSRWYNYGVPGEYCWLSTKNGVIWGFIAPALAISSINFVLLIISIAKIASEIDLKKRQLTRAKQAKLAAIGTLLLVPLLGIPCIVAVPNFFISLPLFQWIFVLLNSPQGLAFFLLYVANNRELLKRAFCGKDYIQSPRHTQMRRGSDYTPQRSSRYKKPSIRSVEMTAVQSVKKEGETNSEFKEEGNKKSS